MTQYKINFKLRNDFPIFQQINLIFFRITHFCNFNGIWLLVKSRVTLNFGYIKLHVLHNAIYVRIYNTYLHCKAQTLICKNDKCHLLKLCRSCCKMLDLNRILKFQRKLKSEGIIVIATTIFLEHPKTSCVPAPHDT